MHSKVLLPAFLHHFLFLGGGAFVVYMPKRSTFLNITCWHRSPIDFEIDPTRSKAVLCFSGCQSWGQILITPQASDSSPLWLEIPTNHVNTHKQDKSKRKEVYEKFMRSNSSTNNRLECVLNFLTSPADSDIAYLVHYHIKNTHRNTLDTKQIMFITLLQRISEVSRLGTPVGYDRTQM